MSHQTGEIARATRSTRPRPPAEPGQERQAAHLGIALAVISAAQLMVVLDGTIVNIALPHIKPTSASPRRTSPGS